MKRVIVFPAYNAEKTLEITFKDIPNSKNYEFILVDDCSTIITSNDLRSKINIISFIKEKNYSIFKIN